VETDCDSQSIFSRASFDVRAGCDKMFMDTY